MSTQPNIVTMKPAGLLDRMASRYGLDATIFERTMAAVAMPQKNGKPDCTREEMISCLVVANEHDLNPLTKEIYFMRTKGGAIQPIVSVDGWLKKLNSHPQFDGMEFVDQLDDKGGMTACTVKIYRKDRARPVEVTEYMDECRGSSEPWKKTGRRMLRHRTLTQGARYAVGFAGVMDLDEFHQWQAGMKDITPVAPTEVAAIPFDIPEPVTVTAPVETEASQEVPAEAVLRDLEKALATATTAAAVKDVRAAFASQLATLDEASHDAAIDMIEATLQATE